MTKVDVSEYGDLDGDQRLHSRAKDVVVKELSSGTEAVLWLDDWLLDDKTLDPVGDITGLKQLFIGRLVAETEGGENSNGAYLFSQRDGRDPPVEEHGTDWVPRDYARVYLADVDENGDEDVDERTPQRGLGEYL